MGKKITLRLLFVIALLVLGNVGVKAKARKFSSEINRKLKLLNKPAIKSIKSEDGDIIDCIDIYKQPAFDHPALKNHKIEMRPSISFPSDTTTTAKNETSLPVLSQIWHKSGSCPTGTIPQAAYLLATGDSYIGARGFINVWNPRVQSPDEYTTAQIWLKNGSVVTFESIEAGWMVNPKLFSDTQPRLFIRWTLDGYQKTGCINHICSGFVQTSQYYGLGIAFQPTSQKGGKQFGVDFRINQDPNQRRWWLSLKDDVIGYWPLEIFNSLQQKAQIVQWGGYVYSKNVKGVTPHTTTAMGSGDFASGLWGSACFILNVRIVDDSLQLKYPKSVQGYTEEPDCYSALNNQTNPALEPIFYFGGPGRGPNCP
ncbi:protein neprosin-like [Castanea sativa]|uniref:protein neprosin-like n=1 Tax=Castanea sativa TaxID=21020 RepID=UPI003F653DEC